MTDEFNESDVIKQAQDEVSPEALKATHDLLASFGQPKSRRWLMRGAAVLGASATMASATALTALPLQAAASTHASVVTDIFSLAATAETLAVTFYNNGIEHATKLGFSHSALAAMKSFAREEDIHRSFFIANGGKVSTSVFSFPDGEDTFESLHAFIETQQQLEVVFDSAFLLAVKVFAGLKGGAPLAQIAAQIAAVEQGHLAVGRYIGGFVPAEPYTFTPVLFTALSQIVPAVQAAGYLSPAKDNRFEYHHAQAAFTVDNEPSGQTVLNATPPRDSD
ncbi:MAG TPA: ferritin-like domain-containing protein [Ktedonobacterales bacterium]